MQPKMIFKIGIDIIMTIALLFLMAYQLIGEENHEWIGVFMFIFFILHHILNRKWSSNILKGKYTKRRILQTILVILIFVCMIGSMVSGIILSRYVFDSVHIVGASATARVAHMLCAYWGFVLMSIHLGFHWNIMLAMAKKAFPKASSKQVILLRVIAVFIAIYGVIAFVKRDIWNYMILKNHFAFFDFTEPVIYFLLDYLAVMALFIFIGYHIGRLNNNLIH